MTVLCCCHLTKMQSATLIEGGITGFPNHHHLRVKENGITLTVPKFWKKYMNENVKCVSRTPQSGEPAHSNYCTTEF
jgi:hypothetical protein